MQKYFDPKIFHIHCAKIFLFGTKQLLLISLIELGAKPLLLVHLPTTEISEFGA